jgi:mannan endo-1,4-beta-mannosidase
MNRKWIALLLTALFQQLSAQTLRLSDSNATKETSALYQNLNKVEKHGFLVGHQDDLAYGVEWKYEPGRSDIHDVTGDYPGLYGWELGQIEHGAAVNLDGVPFDKMKEYIKFAYQNGAAVTISWHADNLLTGKTAWDPAPGSVAAILPGGGKHQLFMAQLDKVAAFIADLKGKNGEAIPILFRPFHELTGNWFWWGSKSSSPEELKALFRFTVNYLRNQKKLHNLIVVYNTGGEFSNKEEFLARYPGDDLIDILSFDSYQNSVAAAQKQFVAELQLHLRVIAQVAKEKNKIAAIGELGFSQVPEARWWTDVLTPALKGNDFAYLLFWRNAGYKAKENATEYYVPYKGQRSEQNFLEFYNLPQTIFQKEAGRLQLYKPIK